MGRGPTSKYVRKTGKDILRRQEMRWLRQGSVPILGLFFVLLCTPVAYGGQGYDDAEDTHPLRIISYPLHLAGNAIEWLVARPLHAIVTQKHLGPFFGRDEGRSWSTDEKESSVAPANTLNR